MKREIICEDVDIENIKNVSANKEKLKENSLQKINLNRKISENILIVIQVLGKDQNFLYWFNL